MSENKERNCFVVCMGGNGSMVMESLIHMCAVNVMSIDHLHALVIDIDAGNGNLNRTTQLCKVYEKAQALLYKHNKQQDMAQSLPEEQPDLDNYFRTKITMYIWTPQHRNSIARNTLNGMIGDNAEAEWLSRLFYTSEELAHSIPIGFKGHPNIGVLFLADMLERHAGDKPLQDFVNALIKFEPDRLLFIGSCFGGTGAASIPMIKRFLIDEIKKVQLQQTMSDSNPSHTDQENVEEPDIECGILAILPYFDVPDAEESLAIDSKQFKDKVKTVLHYYMNDEFKSDPKQSLYQHMYLIGSTHRIKYPKNHSGRVLQQNPANLITWFACTAVEQFFTQDLSLQDTTKLHIAWLKDTAMGWDQFSNKVFPKLEQRCAGMMQMALIYITKLAEDFRLMSNEPTPLMHELTSDLTAGERSEFMSKVNDGLEYFSYYIDYFFQILTHLPLDPEWVEDSIKDPQHKALSSYQDFHGTTMEILKQTLDKYGNDAPNEEHLNLMVRSLTFQRFLNAYVLCRMVQGRMSCWPLNSEADESTIPSDISDTIVLLWNKATQPKYRIRRLSSVGYPIHMVPLVMLLNRISASYFYPSYITMNDLVAYVMDENINKGSVSERAANVIGSFFRAMRYWQT